MTNKKECNDCSKPARWECPNCHTTMCGNCAEMHDYVCPECESEMFHTRVIEELEL
jgi:hypothetical protein